MYLFHNVYGDADELILTKPDDVQAIPFGWTDEIENARNQLINSLNCAVSSLPSIVFEVPEKMAVVGVLVDDVMEESLARLPAHYEEIRIFDLPKPWNWVDILLIIEGLKVSSRPYPSTGSVLQWDSQADQWIPKSESM